MTNDLSVTVIAPLHNAEDYIADFLQRIDGTLRRGDQLLLIDDGSADGTAAAIESWAGSREGVLAVVNEKNLGVAATRNRAVALAETDYIWFVDHDDAWEPDILSRLTAAAGDIAGGADIVICRAEYRTDENLPGRIVDGIDVRQSLSGDGALELMLTGRVHGYLWTKLIKRSVLGDDPFPILSSQSDFVGVSRAVGRSSAVITIPDVLYYYLRREGSITRHREPNLDNHLAAKDAMIAVVAESALARRQDLVDYFTAWFYCHAVAFVPVRSHASRTLRRDGIRRARSVLTTIELRPLFRRSTRVGAEMAAIKFGGNLYSPLVEALLAGHDGLRTARGRLRAGRSGSAA